MEQVAHASASTELAALDGLSVQHVRALDRLRLALADVTADWCTAAELRIRQPDSPLHWKVTTGACEQAHRRVVPMAAGERHSGGQLVLCGSEASQVPLQEIELTARLLGHLADSELDREAAETRARQLEDQAVRDPLTGLGNRRRWMSALRVEASRARRMGRPLVVVIVDLDGLKQVNDEYGHARGDELLRRTGEVLSAQRRVVDTACRLGGDEFGVLALVRDHADADLVAGRVAEQLADAGVRASVGWAVDTARTDDASLQALWQRADKDMYRRRTL